MLREEGVDALTFELLATNCGVGLRTVFRHFKTRQVLLDEVIASLSESKSHSSSLDLASIVLDCCQENEALGMLAPSAPFSDDLTSRIAMNLGDTPHGHRAMICTTLLSAGVWHHLRRKHALTIEEATDCLTWAISELAHRPLARAPVPAADVQEEEFID